MLKRLVVLAAAAVLATGVGIGVWAASSGASETDDCAKTITVEDTATPRLMEYRRDDCADQFPGQTGEP